MERPSGYSRPVHPEQASKLEAQLGIILFLIVTVPLVYVYAKTSILAVHVLFLCEMMLLPLLCILTTGIIIQGRLAEPARRCKRATLEDLAASISILRYRNEFNALSCKNLALIKERIELYELLNQTPDSFFRGGAIAQYATSPLPGIGKVRQNVNAPPTGGAEAAARAADRRRLFTYSLTRPPTGLPECLPNPGPRSNSPCPVRESG